jgi:hypothetical protein
MFKNKLTSVYYNYADKGKMYLTFYQSDDGVNWREVSLINIYDQGNPYSEYTNLTSAIFTPSKIFLGASGSSCTKAYETDDLKTVVGIKAPSLCINGGVSKADGSVLLAAPHSLINYKNSKAAISNASNSNSIDENDSVEFGQAITPENEAECAYDFEINEITKDTFAINKDTKASINLGKNCDILKYCNGMLYYFDNFNKEIKYIKNGTIKVIETFKDLSGSVIVIGDKIYYLKDNNLDSIELENTKKHIEINQDQLGTSISSSNGILYIDKDKIIYASEGSFYVNKAGVSKKLFGQSTSLPYFANCLDRVGIYQNINPYYYNNANSNFMYDSKLYIAGDDGLYCYDLKKDICKKVINECILNWNIYNLDLYIGITPRSSCISNNKFIYMNEKGDIIEYDLQIGTRKVIVPGEKVPKELIKNKAELSISADNDNVYFEITDTIGQQKYKQTLYTYNIKSGKMSQGIVLHEDNF